MIKFKDPRTLIYLAFQVCEIDPCTQEATKIWASSESRIVDLCDLHYAEVRKK